MIGTGDYGRLHMINALQFTDFLYRPRRPEELDTSQGGGVVFNQAPHQVDNVRMVAGSCATSIRAMVGQWDATRPTEGAYQAFLTFEDGVTASLTYNGYAHFDSDEFCDWIAESGLTKDPERYGATRAALKGVGANAEMEMKNRLNYGGSAYKPPHGDGSATRWHQHFGLLIASCAQADLRPQPHGIWVYGNEERLFEDLPLPGVPRVEVMDELCGAVFENRKPLHDGSWALATMEICFAMLQSAREQKEIKLSHQIGVDEARL
jgi:phthalate 4,5-cis-dihydrodiol dehydrogenase